MRYEFDTAEAMRDRLRSDVPIGPYDRLSGPCPKCLGEGDIPVAPDDADFDGETDPCWVCDFEGEISLSGRAAEVLRAFLRLA